MKRLWIWGVVVLLLAVVAVFAFRPWSPPPDPVVEDAKKRAGTALKSIEDYQRGEAARDHAIQHLARQAATLDKQAAEERRRRKEAEELARVAGDTVAELRGQLRALEAQRRAQPKIRSLQEARDAISAALR